MSHFYSPLIHRAVSQRRCTVWLRHSVVEKILQLATDFNTSWIRLYYVAEICYYLLCDLHSARKINVLDHPSKPGPLPLRETHLREEFLLPLTAAGVAGSSGRAGVHSCTDINSAPCMSNSRNILEVPVAIFALVMKTPPVLKWFMEGWAGNGIYGLRTAETINRDAPASSAPVWMSRRWLWLGHAWSHGWQHAGSPRARISTGCLSFSSQCLQLSHLGETSPGCLQRDSHPDSSALLSHSLSCSSTVRRMV